MKNVHEMLTRKKRKNDQKKWTKALAEKAEEKETKLKKMNRKEFCKSLKKIRGRKRIRPDELTNVTYPVCTNYSSV